MSKQQGFVPARKHVIKPELARQDATVGGFVSTSKRPNKTFTTKSRYHEDTDGNMIEDVISEEDILTPLHSEEADPSSSTEDCDDQMDDPANAESELRLHLRDFIESYGASLLKKLVELEVMKAAPVKKQKKL